MSIKEKFIHFFNGYTEEEFIKEKKIKELKIEQLNQVSQILLNLLDAIHNIEEVNKKNGFILREMLSTLRLLTYYSNVYKESNNLFDEKLLRNLLNFFQVDFRNNLDNLNEEHLLLFRNILKELITEFNLINEKKINIYFLEN